LVDAKINFVGGVVIIDGPNSHTLLTGFETYRFTDGTVNQKHADPLVNDLYYYASITMCGVRMSTPIRTTMSSAGRKDAIPTRCSTPRLSGGLHGCRGGRIEPARSL